MIAYVLGLTAFQAVVSHAAAAALEVDAGWLICRER